MKQHTIIFIYQDFFSQANTREHTMFTEVLPKLQTFLTDKCTGSVFRPCFGWSFLMPRLGLWNRISHPENSIVKFWSIHFLQKRNGKKCIFYKHINNICNYQCFFFSSRYSAVAYSTAGLLVLQRNKSVLIKMPKEI